MSSTSTKLEELARAVAKASPQLADVWEATAIIESLGYTDRLIQEELGFDNALALGQSIYQRLSAEQYLPIARPRARRWRAVAKELSIFAEQFSRSFIY